MRFISIMLMVTISACLMITTSAVNGNERLYGDRYISNYVADPNWGKAFELTNYANQAYIIKHNIERAEIEINSMKSYIKEASPILFGMKTKAIEAELNVRGSLLLYDLVSAPLTALSLGPPIAHTLETWKLSNLRPLFSPSNLVGFGLNWVVHRYADWEIARMHRPIDQMIGGVQSLESYSVPSLQRRIEHFSTEYNIIRSKLISTTLDAIETIKTGKDYYGNLRQTLISSGSILSDDLLSHKTKNPPPFVVISFTNPLINRKENMILSQQTYNTLNKWGQQQLDAQRQLSNWLNSPASQQYWTKQGLNYQREISQQQFRQQLYQQQMNQWLRQQQIQISPYSNWPNDPFWRRW